MSIAWDRAAWNVAGRLDRTDFAALLDSADPADRDELLRMRLRWRIDEFAEVCVRPYIEDGADDWAPNNAAHMAVYEVPPIRAGHRTRTARRAILSTRGVGKSGGLKVRHFHAICFSLTRVALILQYSHDDAVEWSDTIREWVDEPCPEVARLFPALASGGTQKAREFHNGPHKSTLIARGWSSGLRGLNKKMVRPDRIYLDDIDDDRDCATETNRTKQQLRLEKKVMPLQPIQGGAEFWWVNTPPHPDSISARAQRRTKGLESWEVYTMPAVSRWPESPLWSEVEAIYKDRAAYPTPDARWDAAQDFYQRNREELDEGAEVLDPERLGILQCFTTRIDVGPTAWESEYQVNPRATSGRIFDPATWLRYRWVVPSKILRAPPSRSEPEGHSVRVADLRVFTHWDWSDGGDDGGFACAGRDNTGRRYLLSTRSWRSMPLTAQARAWAEQVVHWGDRRPQVELPSGTKSSVEQTAMQAIAAVMADLPKARRFAVQIVWKTTTERKEPRICTLEAPLTNGELVVDEEMPASHEGMLEDFDPSRRDNLDDLADAIQRADERARTTTYQAPRSLTRPIA